MTDRSKVWFITGSSRGLGRALAEELLEAGQRVVATARRRDALAPLLERHGGQVLPVELDVTRPEARRQRSAPRSRPSAGSTWW